jgi:xylulokinase
MILAIDLGTTTCKTLLVDSSLRIIKKVAIEYPISTLQAGWAEQDPQEWWGLVKTSIATLTSDLDPGDIHAIGLSGQMHGLVLLDKKGKPLRPAILWNDQRSFPQCNQIYDLVGGVDGLLKHTNNPMLAGYTGGKIIWVLQNEPHIYEKIDRFCLPKDYIRYRLTGEISSDVSDASGTGLYDVRNRCWAANLLEKLKLPSSWFPVVHSSSDYVGEIGPILAGKLGLRTGTPVIAGGGDAVMQVVGGGGTNCLVVL